MPRAKRHVLGSHTIFTGGIDMAVRRAANAGLRAVQIFTTIPQYYGDRSGIGADRVARFRAALGDTGISPEHVLVHAAYVLSVATPDPAKYARAAAGLRKELERSTALGIGRVCFHPGSAVDGDVRSSLARVADAMTAALEAVPGSPRLLVENTAGAGRTVGRTAEEVGAILAALPASVRARAGYGLDTCHLYCSGYDIAASRAAFRDAIDRFQDATGESPAFFHLNDSATGLGSNRDRHVLIGEGYIGAEPFRWLLEDERSQGIPLVLETPQQITDVAKDDASADPWDVRMVALLRELGARDA
ncbi:MAG TPA: deoxyribonuclease IV [Gemmatimonadota bacterium]|nr:deoxyribonuclease IV [Gemmatimonadota bacterium]